MVWSWAATVASGNNVTSRDNDRALSTGVEDLLKDLRGCSSIDMMTHCLALDDLTPLLLNATLEQVECAVRTLLHMARFGLFANQQHVACGNGSSAVLPMVAFAVINHPETLPTLEQLHDGRGQGRPVLSAAILDLPLYVCSSQMPDIFRRMATRMAARSLRRAVSILPFKEVSNLPVCLDLSKLVELAEACHVMGELCKRITRMLKGASEVAALRVTRSELLGHDFVASAIRLLHGVALALQAGVGKEQFCCAQASLQRKLLKMVHDVSEVLRVVLADKATVGSTDGLSHLSFWTTEVEGSPASLLLLATMRTLVDCGAKQRKPHGEDKAGSAYAVLALLNLADLLLGALVPPEGLSSVSIELSQAINSCRSDYGAVFSRMERIETDNKKHSRWLQAAGALLKNVSDLLASVSNPERLRRLELSRDISDVLDIPNLMDIPDKVKKSRELRKALLGVLEATAEPTEQLLRQPWSDIQQWCFGCCHGHNRSFEGLPFGWLTHRQGLPSSTNTRTVPAAESPKKPPQSGKPVQPASSTAVKASASLQPGTEAQASKETVRKVNKSLQQGQLDAEARAACTAVPEKMSPSSLPSCSDSTYSGSRDQAGPDGGNPSVVEASPTVAPARVCSWCGAGAAADRRLKRCGGCSATRYCSVTCQKAHWKCGHKAVCASTGDRAVVMNINTPGPGI